MFRITVSSDSSLDYYSDNKIHNFKVKLAGNIDVTGYECALSEITFPNSILNIRKGYNEVITRVVTEKRELDQVSFTPVTKRFSIPPGNYKSFNHLYSALKKAATESGVGKIPFKISLSENRVESKERVTVTSDAHSGVQFGSDIATHFGFPYMRSGDFKGLSKILIGEQVGEFAPTTTGGINSTYIYTDIIKEQFVGGLKAPLLRIVYIPNMIHPDEEYMSISYDKLYFAKLKSSLLDTIQIIMYDREGHEIHFERGTVTAILEFRKIGGAI
jgi:hypothetical protein